MIIQMDGYWNFNQEDFARFARIQKMCLSTIDENIQIDLSECKFMAPNILTLLGGLKDLGEVHNKNIDFQLHSIKDFELTKYLYNSGFIEYLIPELHINIKNDNCITYKKFNIDEETYDDVVTSYTQDILRLMPIIMSEDLKAELTSKIYEVFINAAEHSYTKIGVHACGHYFPKKEELYISIYDGGIGIVKSVEKMSGKNVEPQKALNWAFKSGNTTVKNIDYKRGLGLDLLKNLVEVNDGKIFVYTNDAIGTICSSGEYYDNVSNNLIGTSINIAIKKDSNCIYRIKK